MRIIPTKSNSLRSILFVCFTLISAIPVLFLATWVQQTALQNEFDAVHEKHLIIAHNITGSLSRYISDLKSGVRIASTNALLRRKSTEVYRFLSELNVDQVWIISDQSAPQLFMDLRQDKESLEIPADIENYFQLNRAKIDAVKNDVYLSGVISGNKNEPLVAAFKSLSDGSYVVSTVRTDYIVQVQKAISFGEKGHAAIVDQHGRVLAHPLPDWTASMKDISSIPPVMKMMAGVTGVTQFYTPALDADMIAGHTTVPETGWGVMIPQPVSELEDNAAAFKFVALCIAITGIFLAALVSWWLSRFITRPLSDIVEYTESVSSGSLHKYEAQTSGFNPTELNKLVISFEDMVGSLITKSADIQTSGDRLREAQKIAKLGNWEINPNTSEMWWSDEIYRIIGITNSFHEAPKGLDGQKQAYSMFLDCFSDDDRNKFEQKLMQASLDQKPFSIEHLITGYDESSVYLHQEVIVKTTPDTNDLYFSGTLQDISERRAYEQKIIKQAHYDSLTGLPNRNLLADRLSHAIDKARRAEFHVPLLVIGLDHFNEVNDTMGHLIGDEVLCIAADRLANVLRSSDTLARLGTDEFAVVIEDLTSFDRTPAIINKILESFKTPIVVNDCEMLISASIGISMYPQDDTTPHGLLQKADTALHASNAMGRGTATFFTSEMDADVQARMSLRSDLATALSNNEFHLVFQPIVDGISGQIVSSEALLRWVHPEKAAIPPDMFIPITEDTGSIDEIGLWVLESAIKQLAQWHKQGFDSLKISVNLSIRQIELGLSPTTVVDLLNKHNVPADRLTLEITESMFANNVEVLRDWMLELRKVGVQFSIDDFGTGYSSLSYLVNMPFSIVKIDRCFVSNLLTGSKDEALVSAIITLSKELGFEVVAEGVEELAELEKLREFKCEFAQGFYFSKPLRSTDFTEQLHLGSIPEQRKAS